MALTAEDLDQIKALMASQAPAEAPAPAKVRDESDRMMEAAAEVPPTYYVHLADGRVLESLDSSSTHVDGVQVIGRYPIEDRSEN
jgi:hypothetical protein